MSRRYDCAATTFAVGALPAPPQRDVRDLIRQRDARRDCHRSNAGRVRKELTRPYEAAPTAVDAKVTVKPYGTVLGASGRSGRRRTCGICGNRCRPAHQEFSSVVLKSTATCGNALPLFTGACVGFRQDMECAGRQRFHDSAKVGESSRSGSLPRRLRVLTDVSCAPASGGTLGLDGGAPCHTSACPLGFLAARPAAVARVGATVEHGATHQALQPRSCHNGNVTPIRYATLFIVSKRVGAQSNWCWHLLTACQ